MPDEEPQPSPFQFRPLDINYDTLRGPLIHTENRGVFQVRLRKKEDLQISPKQLTQLTDSVFRGLELANKISDQSDKEMELTADKNCPGYANASGSISEELINDEPASQSAAILHELMEWLQEEIDINIAHNNEVLCNLAEFLFTGKSRLPWFRSNHDGFLSSKQDTRYTEAWGEILHILLPDTSESNPDKLFNLLLQKRELPDEDKIKIVQTAIESAK